MVEAVRVYLILLQEIAPPAIIKTKPGVNFRLSRQSTNSD